MSDFDYKPNELTGEHISFSGVPLAPAPDRLPESYTHNEIVLQCKDPEEVKRFMSSMFEGGIVPEVGDKIEYFCSARTENSISINMRVVKA